jgi:hypothetical protein
VPQPRDPYTAGKPPAAASLATDCATGCKLLGSCHLGTSTCLEECTRSSTIAGCMRQADNDCNRFAACWFAWSCGGATTRGTHSCSAALDCEATCNGNSSCLCTCINGMAMTSAATLLAYNGCMLACRNDPACIASRCAAQIRRCRAS